MVKTERKLYDGIDALPAFPVVLVTVSRNIMTAAAFHFYSFKPPCVMVGIKPENLTCELITKKRELSEELGIDIVNPKLITVVENELSEVRGKLQQCFYLVKHWNGKITNKTEHMEIKWFSLNELKDLPLGRILRRVIENNFKDFLSYNPLSQ